MSSPRTTWPRMRCSLFVLALLPSTSQAEAIADGIVTPLGDTATLTHSHPAFGGRQRGETIDPVDLTEQNDKTTELSDVARLEAFFNTFLERNFNVLKDSYASAACDHPLWSSESWPTYKDGINAAWKDGRASPAEKYAQAFGRNVDAFLSGISRSTGVLSETSTTVCICDSDCKDLGDDSRCGLRAGESHGYCIPTWHGLCHASAAAAMFESEPKCDVQKNNVTFDSVDMKALIAQVYDGAAIDVVFAGARFNGPDSPEDLDEYGRYDDAARKDMNPAVFHMAVANILGKQHQPFIVDVSSDRQVRNQPVQKYEYLEAEIVEATALSLDYFNTATYPFNDAAAFLAKCTTRLTWTTESIEDEAVTTTDQTQAYTEYKDYEYCLELDENYTIIGGEWLGRSCKDHPNFLWFPAAKPSEDTVTDTGISYADVLGLVQESLQCVDMTSSSDGPNMSSTKTHGSDHTKSPSYTKTPATKTPEINWLNPTYPPSTDAPKTYHPSTDAPKTYPPMTDDPKTYYPSTDAPKTYHPSTDAPKTYPPSTDLPETTAPPTYALRPGLTSYEDTFSPATTASQTDVPSDVFSSYSTETSLTPTDTSTYASTYASASLKQSSTPKATDPPSQSNPSQDQNNSKWSQWYRQFAGFMPW